MILYLTLIIVGFFVLIKGADWLVDGASALAKKYKISDLAIGLTIVAFGTSAPELVVNTFASFKGHQDIVFGNIIGSNNFNLFIILGISGLITPLLVQKSTVKFEIPISLLAAVVLFLMTNDTLFGSGNTLSRLEGFILLIFFCGFLYYVYSQLKTSPEESEQEFKEMKGSKIALLIVAGLVGLIAGGRLVVDNAIHIAHTLGVSEKIIGLTIVAAGTSLPELATSAVAAVKKKADIAVGNIIGSNIFNIFLILGVSSIIRPIKYTLSFNTDIAILVAGTLFLLLAMFTGFRKRLDRWQAAILLISYIAYTVYLVTKEV
jgi:cation:H+ antiporter